MDYKPMAHEERPFKQDIIDSVNQRCYDNCASNWDRFPYQEDLPDLIHKYYTPKLGTQVLDVGSGTGVLAKWLMDQGFTVHCIDPSPEMVRRTRGKGLPTEQTSIQSYQPKQSYGMIFAILSLIHVPKDDFVAQVKKLADVLPSGGMLFLGMLEGESEAFDSANYPRFFAYYTPEEIKAKVGPLLTLKDYRYFKSGTGYMLFAFQKQ